MALADIFIYTYSGVCLLIGFIYLLIQISVRIYFQELPDVENDPSFSPTLQYSIVIAARNEVDNIVACVESILNSNFPKKNIELIVVDDHSEDGTLEVLKKIANANLKILQLENGVGKKAALAFGIGKAKGDWIVTTDADCLWSENGLRLLAQEAERRQPKFIAGPVLIAGGKKWIERFQEIDVLGTMAVTGAGIKSKYVYMANGAHLAFPKSVFEELEGYAGIDEVASGDDMLFLQKVVKVYPDDVIFLKSAEAVVSTVAEGDVKSFFVQRLRWASKAGAFSHRKTWWIMMLVGMKCFLVCTTGILCAIGFQALVLLFGFQLINKWTADSLVLQSSSVFFGKRVGALGVMVGSIFHCVYVSVVGLWSFFVGKVNWKGRGGV